jgi:RNA polymerase sigma-70 factor (ECF subfamily)
VTIARDLCIDRTRSSKFRLEILAAETPDWRRPGDAAPSAEDVALRENDQAELLRAVANTTSSQQECIVLRYFGGMTFAQIGQVMGRSVDAVKQLHVRALHRLNRELSPAVGHR